MCDGVGSRFAGHSSQCGSLAVRAFRWRRFAGNDICRFCQLFALVYVSLPDSLLTGLQGSKRKSLERLPLILLRRYWLGKRVSEARRGPRLSPNTGLVLPIGLYEGHHPQEDRTLDRSNLPFPISNGAGKEAPQRGGGGGSSPALENAFSTFSVMRETLLS